MGGRNNVLGLVAGAIAMAAMPAVAAGSDLKRSRASGRAVPPPRHTPTAKSSGLQAMLSRAKRFG